jgi:hypothetical protein
MWPDDLDSAVTGFIALILAVSGLRLAWLIYRYNRK